MYDKLGDLLSEALEKGELPKSEKETQNESVEETFSDFKFAKSEAERVAERPAEASSEPKQKKLGQTQQYQIIKNTIPNGIKSALDFIGIPAGVSFDDAKKIYREKLMRYHPDRRADNPVLQKVAKEKTERLLKEWGKLEEWYAGN